MSSFELVAVACCYETSLDLRAIRGDAIALLRSSFDISSKVVRRGTYAATYYYSA